MGILVNILVGIIVTLLSYWWLKKIRRRTLEWLPSVPGIPILGNALDLKDPTTIIQKFTQYTNQYGLYHVNIFSDQFICAAEPEFLEFVLGRKDILDKIDSYGFLSNWLGDGVLTANAQIWKKSRKILNPAFHFSIIEQFIGTFNKNADILIELLDKEVGNGFFDIFPYTAMAALDSICETTMGVSIDAQRNRKSDYVQAVKEKCRLLVERTFSPIKSTNLLYPLTKDYYDEKKLVNILHSHTLSVIKARKEEIRNQTSSEQPKNADNNLGIKKKKVLLDLLLEITVDGRQLTDDEIRQEVDTFMFAGHDTTGSALGYTLYLLSTHPEVQNRAFEEQKEIFGNDQYRSSTLRDLQDMKYLEMVIKESLRLYPPVPFVGRKVLKDIEYKPGKIIHEGTSIFVLIFCANRNPKYFLDHNKFNPSRFEENRNISQYVYLPFSAGPRNCIGQKFAMLEMKSVISKILRNYELQPSGQDLLLTVEVVLKSLNGINVKIIKRKNWTAET